MSSRHTQNDEGLRACHPLWRRDYNVFTPHRTRQTDHHIPHCTPHARQGGFRTGYSGFTRSY